MTSRKGSKGHDARQNPAGSLAHTDVGTNADADKSQRLYHHLYGDLQILLEVRDALDGGRSFRTVEELAEEIEKRRQQSPRSNRQKSLSGTHLRKTIAEVEKLFFGGTQRRLVERDRGRPDDKSRGSDQSADEEGSWRLPQESDDHAQSESVFDAIRELLIKLSQSHQQRQSYSIIIGASHATEWLVENAIRRFHHDISNHAQRRRTKCDVIINHGKSHELRRDGTGGKYHIVVASCADLSLRQLGRVSIGSAPLDLHVLVHRRNQLAIERQISWSDLAGWTLIVPSSERWPRPTLPLPVFDHGLRLVTAEHYRDALASVRASGDSKRMACIAPARLHAPDELRDLRAYSMPGLKKLLLVGALKSSVRHQKAGKTTQQLMNKLAEAILTALSEK